MRRSKARPQKSFVVEPHVLVLYQRRTSRFSESVSLTVYPLKMIRDFGKRWLSAASFGHGAVRKIMPSGAACDSDNDDNANLFSSIMSAKPIGVNAAMTSP